MPKQIELVISSERIFIKLSKGANILELAHAQPKLFNTEHARDRYIQTEKIAFEVRGHVGYMIECVVIPNSAVLLLFHLLMYSKPPPKSRLLSKLCLASCFFAVIANKSDYLAMFRCGDPIDSTCLRLAHCA